MRKGWKMLQRGENGTKQRTRSRCRFPGPWASRRSAHLRKVSAGNACSAGWSFGEGVPRRPARMHALHFNHLGEYTATPTLFLPRQRLSPHCNYTLALSPCLKVSAVCHTPVYIHWQFWTRRASYVCFHNSLWAPNAPQFNWLRNQCVEIQNSPVWVREKIVQGAKCKWSWILFVLKGCVPFGGWIHICMVPYANF